MNTRGENGDDPRAVPGRRPEHGRELRDRVAELTDVIVGVSRSVHTTPELGFEEFRSSAVLVEVLTEHGFEVRRPVAELRTGFTARYGSGPLVVGLCAEYDALPEIGHACGHNIIAAIAVGAGLALAPLADRLGITVEVIGTPAEENGGGKVIMLEAGVFDDVACALMAHPAPVETCSAGSLAITDLRVGYEGKESHAALAPYLGVNAADAMNLAQVAIGLARQQFERDQMVHGVTTRGGLAPNVIPASTEAEYYLRAGDAESLARLEERVRRCFEAGAVATGARLELRRMAPAYHELVPDPWLSTVYREVIVDLGRTPLSPEVERDAPTGSTDMGNVSRLVPSIHPTIALDAGGAVNHQPEFTEVCAGPSGDRAAVDGALALALTAACAAEDRAQRDQLLEGVTRRSRRAAMT
ncbi:M20 family metallopeptidase [Nocardiopsis alba]|uniref:M20 family metallopeptidase n=1 Tax=Nocardiopsis alba TaxID=53437 RepID=UPI0036654D52